MFGRILPERDYGLQPVGSIVADAFKAFPRIGDTVRTTFSLGETVTEPFSPLGETVSGPFALGQLRYLGDASLPQVSARQVEVAGALGRIEQKNGGVW